MSDQTDKLASVKRDWIAGELFNRWKINLPPAASKFLDDQIKTAIEKAVESEMTRVDIDSQSWGGIKLEWRPEEHRLYAYSSTGDFLFSGSPAYLIWRCTRESRAAHASENVISGTSGTSEAANDQRGIHAACFPATSENKTAGVQVPATNPAHASEQGAEQIGGIIIPKHPPKGTVAEERLIMAIENMMSFCPPAVQNMAKRAIESSQRPTPATGDTKRLDWLEVADEWEMDRRYKFVQFNSSDTANGPRMQTVREAIDTAMQAKEKDKARREKENREWLERKPDSDSVGEGIDLGAIIRKRLERLAADLPAVAGFNDAYEVLKAEAKAIEQLVNDATPSGGGEKWTPDTVIALLGSRPDNMADYRRAASIVADAHNATLQTCGHSLQPRTFDKIQEHLDKIFDHKWLDPKCVEHGCQSLQPRDCGEDTAILNWVLSNRRWIDWDKDWSRESCLSAMKSQT